MEIEVTLTRTMYAKLNVLLVFRQWSFYLFIGIFCIFLALFIILEVPGVIAAFAFLFVVFLIHAIVITYNVFSSKNRNMFRTVRYFFNDENVTVSSSISEGTVKWEVFIKWKRVGGY